MTSNPVPQYNDAVGAIRVSSVKQGTEGDSPEAQREQIERFAATRDLTIKKFFVFLESASKEQQPMQEAVDYCKDPKNEISYFIIKSIDRFTRGGSLSYDLLKNQLEDADVRLVDIYGIIGSEKVNTLEHLGVEYKWSVYSPSKKSEILEAERSKDELRDIMTRMIGAQVRYARLGYWVRMAPYGYANQRVDTPHGKRTVLVPHPTESKQIIELFKLRASGQYTDEEIVDKINQMGYSGRRSPKTATRLCQDSVVERRIPLNAANLWRIIRHPVYAGVNNEKWTNSQPVKFAFDGLVSIELFNQANRGRRIITEADDGRITIEDFKEERHTNKGKRSLDYPFKRFVMCPHCESPLTGSASRGRTGKHYPAYHCSNKRKGKHYFRVSKDELEDLVDEFIGNLKISPKRVDQVMGMIDESLGRVEAVYNQQIATLDQRAVGLRAEIQAGLGKLRILNSTSTIKYLEGDIERLEGK